MFDSFTREYCDKSTEAGFEFIFYCDLCHGGYHTPFIKAERYRRSGILHRILHRLFLPVCSSKTNTGHFEAMSPEWQEEHRQVYEKVQSEVKTLFNRCPKCLRWVCDHDFNIEEGMCIQCAPAVMELTEGCTGNRV